MKKPASAILACLLTCLALLQLSGCKYRLQWVRVEDETESVSETEPPTTEAPETLPPTTEAPTISPLQEQGIIYESENYRPEPMDTAAVLRLYTDSVNAVKRALPGFKKKDDQNFTDLQAGGKGVLVNKIFNMVAREVMRHASGDSSVATVPPQDEEQVLEIFPIYGQEFACDLTELSLITSAVCYTDGEHEKIVITLADTSNAEPVSTQYGRIMTPAPRQDIADKITKYFVMLDEEKFKFDFRYTGSEIICILDKETKKLQYLSQKMIVLIDINLDLDFRLFSAELVKASGTVVNHVEYTDFDWSQPTD